MGTQNFFLFHARDETEKISLFISLAGSKSFLFYFLPCGYFLKKPKGLCMEKSNFLLLEGDVSKEILVLRGWESITG